MYNYYRYIKTIVNSDNSCQYMGFNTCLGYAMDQACLFKFQFIDIVVDMLLNIY